MGAHMKDKEFAAWLREKYHLDNSKQISDCVSRARRFERAFAAYGIDLDEEISRDGGMHLLSVSYHEGHNKEHDKYPELDLPFEHKSRIIGTINNAAKRYVVFRCTTEGIFLNELESNVVIRNVYRNYLKRSRP